jgi:CrcB protein
MIEWVFVAIGGAAGSITRYLLGIWLNPKSAENLPIGTFAVNITGAFLLGVVVSMIRTPSYGVFLADGFLGAYTTFSTFIYESYCLLKHGERIRAGLYLILSILLGVLGFACGFLMGTMPTKI